MKIIIKEMRKLLLPLFLLFLLAGCSLQTKESQAVFRESIEKNQSADLENSDDITLKENDSYTSKEEVAFYIYQFGKLPLNFITKKEAKNLGWDNSKGNLWEVAPGKSIGGDFFGNYEEVLPEGKYKECDIDYDGGYRGKKRLIYGEDGSIYYTENHYKSFEKLY